MDWSAFGLAGMAALASIGAAAIAARTARSTRRTDIQAQRLRELESRLAEKKHQTYAPMIELLSQMLNPQNLQRLSEEQTNVQTKYETFSAWIAIYGSDDAVRAWHRLQQGAFNEAPPMIFIRLYADFVQAARRDMGNPESTITTHELLGLRLRDLYTSEDVEAALTASWEELETRFSWRAPWVHSA